MPQVPSRPHAGGATPCTPRRSPSVGLRPPFNAIVVTILLGVGWLSTVLMTDGLPAGASSRANTPKPLGTTFAFPDAGGTVVDITLDQVVVNAPAKSHYKGLHGKGPVIGLEFSLKNISAKAASLALFSSVLYYSNAVAAVTGTDGATTLGPSLNLKSPMAPGSHRQGWVTAQGAKKTLVKIQSTLNGANTGSWKPTS